MIETLSTLGSHPFILGVAFLAIVAAYGVWRALKPAQRNTPRARPIPPLAPADDPANLDSSHIGGPLI
jgi:hypothetical protein